MPLIYIPYLRFNMSTVITVQPSGQSSYDWDPLTQGKLNLNIHGLYTLSVPRAMQLQIKAWGAAGAGTMTNSSTAPAANIGGAGGFAGGLISLYAGTYIIWVGEGGNHFQDAATVFGGGGNIPYKNAANYSTGAGGGLSGIFRGSATQANALVIAGGGGGGGGGGSAGGSGQNGTTTSSLTQIFGKGGTTSAGGAAGSGNTTYGGNGYPGYELHGGDAKNNAYCGGGGGGGYFGGGSGGCNNTIGGVGGGGSCYCAPSVITPTILNSNYSSVANASDPDRGTAGSPGATGTGVTLATAKGKDGAVVLFAP